MKLRARRSKRTSQPPRPRGVALLLALIMVALITAFVTEFDYGARTKLMSASHARDELRASYFARSGIRTYGLLLIFGRQASNNQLLQGMLSSIGLSLDGAAMVCKTIPFLDTAMLRFLAGAEGMSADQEEEGLLSMLGMGKGDEASPGTGGEALRVPGLTDEVATDEGPHLRRKLLDFEGDFKVDCKDESSRIDLNGFANTNWLALPLQQHPTGLMLHALFSPQEYDPLFEERLKMDRWDLIANIKDWVDADRERSGFWGGDEESAYDDYQPRYRPRNAKFETVEQVQLVAGVTDEVWETFGPALSVHTRNFKINVNTVNGNMMWALIRAFTDPMLVPEPALQTVVMKLMIARIFLPFRNANDFVQRVNTALSEFGVVLDQPRQVAMREMVSTDSQVFRLTATGYVGDSTHTLDVAVRVRGSSVQYLEWKE